MQWFRMYSEFATDPKVQSMDETLQRRFIMFLCLHCSGEYEQLSEEELAFALRITPEQLAETRRVFGAKGFLDAEGKIRNWNKRQYKSDSSTERVQKHRASKAKQEGNVTETPSDTDTESDSEAEKSKRARPKRASRVPADFSPDTDFALRELPDLDVNREVQKFRDWEFKTPRSDWPAVWRNWVERCREKGEYAKRPNGAGGQIKWI